MRKPDSKKADLRGADAAVLKILALQSGDLRRVRRAIGDADDIPTELTPHVIALLGTPSVAFDAMRGLRAVAAKRTGALVDALLDARLAPAVRRRLARVMSACRAGEAVEGLLQACEDEDRSLRRQCARTLFVVRRRYPEIRLPEDQVLSLVDREIASGAADAGLIFTLLALVFPPEAIRAAYRSLRGSNAHARGFALEYLDGVLPGTLRKKLDPIVAGIDG
jgi:hypothetical protein